MFAHIIWSEIYRQTIKNSSIRSTTANWYGMTRSFSDWDSTEVNHLLVIQRLHHNRTLTHHVMTRKCIRSKRWTHCILFSQARYTDPHSRLRYATTQEFQRIKTLPSDIVTGYLALRKVNPVVHWPLNLPLKHLTNSYLKTIEDFIWQQCLLQEPLVVSVTTCDYLVTLECKLRSWRSHRIRGQGNLRQPMQEKSRKSLLLRASYNRKSWKKEFEISSLRFAKILFF